MAFRKILNKQADEKHIFDYDCEKPENQLNIDPFFSDFDWPHFKRIRPEAADQSLPCGN